MNNDKILALAAECGIQLMPGSKYKEKLIAFAQALTQHHIGDVNDMIAAPAPVTPVGDEPFMYVRMLDGDVDWSEDCVSPDTSCGDDYNLEDGYTTLPLYTRASMPVKDGVIDQES